MSIGVFDEKKITVTKPFAELSQEEIEQLFVGWLHEDDRLRKLWYSAAAASLMFILAAFILIMAVFTSTSLNGGLLITLFVLAALSCLLFIFSLSICLRVGDQRLDALHTLLACATKTQKEEARKHNLARINEAIIALCAADIKNYYLVSHSPRYGRGSFNDLVGVL